MDNATSYESILSRQLSLFPDTLDKREGSFLHDQAARYSLELAAAYYSLSYIEQLGYVDTSEGEWLTRLCSTFGIDRQPAIHAVRKALFTSMRGEPLAIPVGSRWAIQDITFAVSKQLAPGEYELTCEQAGETGNQHAGDLIHISHVSGLGAAILDALPLISGAEEESDEALRQRFYVAVRKPAFAGNIPSYMQQTLALEGVGAVQVFPVWDGPGTVGLVIGDTQKEPVTQTLIERVQAYWNENQPIGHNVTVGTAAYKDIDISAELVLVPGAQQEVVIQAVQQAIGSFVAEIDFASSIVYHSRLAAQISFVDGVLDVTSLTLDGQPQNVQLHKRMDSFELAKEGSVHVNVV